MYVPTTYIHYAKKRKDDSLVSERSEMMRWRRGKAEVAVSICLYCTCYWEWWSDIQREKGLVPGFGWGGILF